ncbi:Class II abasic (AP) endonuclease [Diatrype stigma]|uniref:Class II abasic (AP) endonuclease n=1 Tax=Diatrype stigma TaxID=117547 RepID=A0AAN9YN11_9PEZI
MEGEQDFREADIVVMQELKIQRKDLRDDMVLVPGWDVYFSLPKHKKGIRHRDCLYPPPLLTRFRDLPPDQQIGGYPKPGQLAGLVDELALDSEGRCVILEFPAFVIIGTYSPANSDGNRDDFRYGFLDALDVRIRNLVAMGKRVILTGDLNVIRDTIDTANLAERLRKENMPVEEFFAAPSRRLFNHLVFGGNVYGERDEGKEKPVLWDLGRLFHPTRQGMFTCWETKKNCRPGNFGSRIDYVLCSDDMKDWFVDANIQEGLMGSDHCPVYATIGDVVKIDGNEVHVKDIMSPEGVFQRGQRLRDWTPKDLLPMSARLIPEFDRRRNIKDMFFKKPAVVAKPSPSPMGEPSSSENDQPSNDISSSAKEPSEPPLPPSTSPSSAPSPLKQPSTGFKRTSSTTTSSARPQKKTKGNLTREPSAPTSTSTKGQSSLMGFFKPKATDNPSGSSDAKTQTKASTGTDGTLEADGPSTESIEGVPHEQATEDSKDANAPPSTTNEKKFIDPIESKESWSKLMSKRTPPKCEHGDECTSFVTKKAGANKGKLRPLPLQWSSASYYKKVSVWTYIPLTSIPGRQFYVCPRPLGPSGDKERGTEWRCSTFIWSSDWNG